MKFQSKITLTLLILILIFGTCASIISFYLTKSEFTKQVASEINSNTIALSHEVYQIFRQSQDISKSLSKNSQLQNFLLKSKQSAAELSSVNQELENFNLGQMYASIYVLDPDGNAIVSTDARLTGSNYGFRDYFKESIKGREFVSVAVGITTGELGYFFSSPIHNPTDQSQILGVVVVKLKPKIIEDALLVHKVNGFDSLLIDKYGITILSSDPKKIFHSIGNLSEINLNELKNNNTYGKSSFETLGYDEVETKLLSVKNTPINLPLYDHFDNESELISLIKIDQFPFYLLYEGKISLIDKVSLRSSLVIAISVLCTAIVSMLIIIPIVRQILKNQESVESQIIQKSTDLEKLNKLMVGRELRMIELKEEISKINNQSKLL